MPDQRDRSQTPERKFLRFTSSEYFETVLRDLRMVLRVVSCPETLHYASFLFDMYEENDETTGTMSELCMQMHLHFIEMHHNLENLNAEWEKVESIAGLCDDTQASAWNDLLERFCDAHSIQEGINESMAANLSTRDAVAKFSFECAHMAEAFFCLGKLYDVLYDSTNIHGPVPEYSMISGLFAEAFKELNRKYEEGDLKEWAGTP